MSDAKTPPVTDSLYPKVADFSQQIEDAKSRGRIMELSYALMAWKYDMPPKSYAALRAQMARRIKDLPDDRR